MLGWWHVLTRCLILPSQGSWDVLPPAGWQRQRDTASVPDKAVGATNEAAVTLQTEAQSLSQKLTLFPHGEVQCASNARCPSRSVCGSQDGAVGCHPGAVLHKNRGCKKDNFDWFFFSFCVWLNIQIYHIHRFFFFFKNFFLSTKHQLLEWLNVANFKQKHQIRYCGFLCYLSFFFFPLQATWAMSSSQFCISQAYIPQLQLQDLHNHQTTHCEKIIRERM